MRALYAVSVILVLPSLAWSQTSSSKLRREFQKIYDRYAIAIKLKDLGRAMSFSSKDRVYTTLDGRLLKRWQIERALETQFKATKKFTEVNYQVQSATSKGSSVEVKAVAGIIGQSFDPVRKKSVNYKTFVLAQDSWIKSGGAWKIRATKILSDRTTYNGQTAIATTVKPLSVKPRVKKP